MNTQSDTPTYFCGPLYTVLYGLNRNFWVDGIEFHVRVDGDSAVVSFDSFSDAFKLYGLLSRLIANAGNREEIYTFIQEHLKITVFLQSRIFGVAGPNASTFFSKIFFYCLMHSRNGEQ